MPESNRRPKPSSTRRSGKTKAAKPMGTAILVGFEGKVIAGKPIDWASGACKFPIDPKKYRKS